MPKLHYRYGDLGDIIGQRPPKRPRCVFKVADPQVTPEQYLIVDCDTSSASGDMYEPDNDPLSDHEPEDVKYTSPDHAPDEVKCTFPDHDDDDLQLYGCGEGDNFADENEVASSCASNSPVHQEEIINYADEDGDAGFQGAYVDGDNEPEGAYSDFENVDDHLLHELMLQLQEHQRKHAEGDDDTICMDATLAAPKTPSEDEFGEDTPSQAPEMLPEQRPYVYLDLQIGEICQQPTPTAEPPTQNPQVTPMPQIWPPSQPKKEQPSEKKRPRKKQSPPVSACLQSKIKEQPKKEQVENSSKPIRTKGDPLLKRAPQVGTLMCMETPAKPQVKAIATGDRIAQLCKQRADAKWQLAQMLAPVPTGAVEIVPPLGPPDKIPFGYGNWGDWNHPDALEAEEQLARRHSLFNCDRGPVPPPTGPKEWRGIPWNKAANAWEWQSRDHLPAEYSFEDWWDPVMLEREHWLARRFMIPWPLRGPPNGPTKDSPKRWRGMEWRPQTRVWASRGGRRNPNPNKQGNLQACCPQQGASSTGKGKSDLRNVSAPWQRPNKHM